MIADETLVPTALPDCGGKSFYWVWLHRKEFVKFTLEEIKEPTGFFKDFQQYCQGKIKNGRT